VFCRAIFQEWWGNINAVVLVKLHLELPLQYSSPMLEGRWIQLEQVQGTATGISPGHSNIQE